MLSSDYFLLDEYPVNPNGYPEEAKTTKDRTLFCPYKEFGRGNLAPTLTYNLLFPVYCLLPTVYFYQLKDQNLNLVSKFNSGTKLF